MPRYNATPAIQYPPPPAVKALPVVDFTGGLNLRAVPYQLATNESGDMRDVDVDPYGGIKQRRGFTSYGGTSSPALPMIADGLWAKYSSDVTVPPTIVFQQGSGFGYGDPTLTTVAWGYKRPDSLVTTGRMRAAQGNASAAGNLYIQRNALNAPIRWDGTTATVLTASTDTAVRTTNDYGQMPKAKHIAAYGVYMFIANEGTTATDSRVRYSHPGSAEDWHTNDSFDIRPGGDGDEITAIVPFGDRLMVFKNNSMHAVFGTDIDTFNVVDIAEVGAVSAEAVAVAPHGLYFFSWPDGIMFYNGTDYPRVVSEKLNPLFNGEATVPLDGDDRGSASLAWLHGRLWFSGLLVDEATPTTWVLDPTIRSTRKSDGAWVAYRINLGPMLELSGVASPQTWGFGVSDVDSSLTTILGCPRDHARIVDLDTIADADVWYADYVSLSGANKITTPDAATWDTIEDIDLRARVAADLWESAEFTVVGKWTATGDQRSYRLRNYNNGGTYTLRLEWSTDGIVTSSKTASVGHGFTNATIHGVRATMDASTNTVKFYTSDDDTTWVQLGSTQDTAGGTSIFNSTTQVTLGASDDGDYMAGKFYNFSYDNAYDGSASDQSLNVTKLATGASSQTDGGTVYTFPVAATMTTNTITSYYRTAWLDAGEPARVKRWRRPEVTVPPTLVGAMSIEVYHDYDDSTVQRTLTLDTTDAAVTVIKRLGQVGRARAVQLKIKSPSTSERWQINGFTLKYIPLRMRS